jgi:hypothetical protein
VEFIVASEGVVFAVKIIDHERFPKKNAGAVSANKKDRLNKLPPPEAVALRCCTWKVRSCRF